MSTASAAGTLPGARTGPSERRDGERLRCRDAATVRRAATVGVSAVSRLLGVDLGARRIGLAVGDSTTGSSWPLAMIRRETPDADAERIARLLREQSADEIVVGLPLNMDGTEGAQARETREWADQLAVRLAVPLRWRDERLTSVAAESSLGRPRRGRSGGPPSPAAREQRRASLDRQAARLIVEAELRERAGLSS